MCTYRMFRVVREDFRAITVNMFPGPCKRDYANCGRIPSGWYCGGRLVLHDLCVILVREIVLADASTIKVNRARNRFRRFFHRDDRGEGSRSLRDVMLHLLLPIRCASFRSACGRDLSNERSTERDAGEAPRV